VAPCARLAITSYVVGLMDAHCPSRHGWSPVWRTAATRTRARSVSASQSARSTASSATNLPPTATPTAPARPQIGGRVGLVHAARGHERDPWQGRQEVGDVAWAERARPCRGERRQRCPPVPAWMPTGVVSRPIWRANVSISYLLKKPGPGRQGRRGGVAGGRLKHDAEGLPWN